MATSRRKFLQSSTLVALAAGFPLDAAAKSFHSKALLNGITGSGAGAGSLLSMDDFTRCLRTDFLLKHAGTNDTWLKLVEVCDSRKGRERQTARECFSLLFAGAQDVTLQQNTYDVEHSSLGKFQMLVVPVGSSQYEAVFNRLY